MDLFCSSCKWIFVRIIFAGIREVGCFKGSIIKQKFYNKKAKLAAAASKQSQHKPIDI